MAQQTTEPRIAGRMAVRDTAGDPRMDEEGAPVRWGTREHMEQVINEGGSVLHNGEIISSHRALPAREAIAAALNEREAASARGVASRVKELQGQVDEHGDDIEALKREIDGLHAGHPGDKIDALKKEIAELRAGQKESKHGDEIAALKKEIAELREAQKKKD